MPLDECQDGRRLPEDVRAGRSQEVLVHRPDRLGCSLRALLNVNAALEAADVTVRSAIEWWYRLGAPNRGRFGLTVTPLGEHVLWLDRPDSEHRWAIPAPLPGQGEGA